MEDVRLCDAVEDCLRTPEAFRCSGVVPFSPWSSLCFNVFLRSVCHESLSARLSYLEKGFGGSFTAVPLLLAGGNADKGSSIGIGEV
jgi:hypothetical protein